MCGIIGAYSGSEVLLRNVEKQLSKISYRGPDESGVTYIFEGLFFGHARLSIISAEDGQQPFKDVDSGNVIIYNGELYNYLELRDELASFWEFKTNSDTEVVLASYSKWGPKCISRFRGMFAFAIHDKEKNKLFLARDHAGIKPLYFFRGENELAFCSELKPLAKILETKELNKNAINTFLALQYIPGSDTIYKSISKLTPGDVIEYDISRDEFKKYYVEPVKYYFNKENIESVFDETIQKYIRADVPVGVFLSGGIDSTLVSYFAKKYIKDLHSYSIHFGDKKYSEYEYSQYASKKIGTIHHAYKLTESDASFFMDNITSIQDEPSGDSSCIPTYFVSKLASKDLKVILSGDGADELFGGYDIYYKLKMNSNLRFKKLVCVLPLPYSLKRRLAPNNWLFENARLVLPKRKLKRIINYNLDHYFNLSDESFQGYMDHDFKNYMVEDVLMKVDKMSMKHSIEVRTPFLDQRIVSYANSLGENDKFSKKQGGKALLKQQLTELLGDEFVNRKKMGFGIPLFEWMQTIFKKDLEKILSRGILSEFCDENELNKLYQDFLSGKDYSAFFYNVLVLGKWIEHND